MRVFCNRLFSQSKPTTKFLYFTRNHSNSQNREKFFLCAIFHDKSYLVSSNDMSTTELGEKSICDNTTIAYDEVRIKKISRRRHCFVAVYVNDSTNNYFSDEIQTFCKPYTKT